MHKNLNFTNETTLVDRARRELERRFVTLLLPPGSVWTEGSLSELLDIGRTPVREAVAGMAMDGLVTVIRRAGIVVTEISVEDQMAVLDARRVLEKLVSIRASVRCTDDERNQLLEMADGIQQAGETQQVEDYLQFHFQIKRFVAQCARNKFAERALRPLHTLSQRFYFAHHRAFNNLPVVGPAHAALTRAIVARDEAQVARQCDHVSDIADQFTRDLLGTRDNIKA
ncbi:MAG: GntR family transcriptional regulator [Polaromonas sp.]|uniref:GntR family transcriptional regulator n=1 Tax=Polaromonas sp. TaxID=1869339 RepID=UPI0024898FAE|nr:GntR family transcriptional regulator [Polaromonas sp.]MDI1270582.1 GntR family transcriptional regulator [Polaromonas sp.]